MDWVQCDGCNKWFHMVCVGLLKTELKADEDFVCKACARKPESGGDNSVVSVGTRSTAATSSPGGGGATMTTKVKRTNTRST